MRKLSEKLRKQIITLAKGCCEYCHLHEDDLFLAFGIDHIMAQKHGGGNELGNLAYCCPHCNQHKGTDFATFLENYSDIVPLFNPRTNKWSDHFYSYQGEIIAKTRIGEATIKVLKLNQIDMLLLRKLLNEIGRYPDE